MTATITSKGQLTIPKAIREQLNLQSGDKVEFLVDKDGSVRIVTITASITKLKGMVPRPKKVVSLEEMNKAIEMEGGKQ